MIIEIPEPQATVLKQYCRQHQLDEEDIVRQAVSQFLSASLPKPRISDYPAFGSSKHRNIDGLEYEHQLRDGADDELVSWGSGQSSSKKLKPLKLSKGGKSLSEMVIEDRG